MFSAGFLKCGLVCGLPSAGLRVNAALMSNYHEGYAKLEPNSLYVYTDLANKTESDSFVLSPDTLPCACHGSLPGKTAVQLGPLW